MDWERAIERNLDELLGVLVRLFVLSGLRTGVTVATLPRFMRIRILAILRPAEFAARRLIAIAACKLVVLTVRPAGKRGKQPPNSDDLPSHPTARAARGERLPALPLFDPFKPFGHPWLEESDDAAREAWPAPWLDPNEPVSAAGVCRRIRALERALNDLEGHAACLARWRARRHLETTRVKRWSPMRPGRPPGWRKRPDSAVEIALWECHRLAHEAWDTS